VLERDGLALRQPARLAMVALDEGDDQPMNDACRAAPTGWPSICRLDARLSTPGHRGPTVRCWRHPGRAGPAARVGVRRRRCCRPCAAPPQALGVASLRAPLLALRACAGRCRAGRADGRCRARTTPLWPARLVLAPRATRLPGAARTRARRRPAGQTNRRRRTHRMRQPDTAPPPMHPPPAAAR